MAGTFRLFAESPPQRSAERKTSGCHRVFSYGDSLTAGTSPPLDDLSPYAPHMERELNRPSTAPESPPFVPVVVRWLGLPGWTAASLCDSLDSPNGLRSILQRIKASTVGQPASLCVILAGTNDLAYGGDAGPIVGAIAGLHEAAHGEGVRTVAVSIPPSGWQCADGGARRLADEVNGALRELCANEAPGGIGSMATFVEFPIREFRRESGLWAPDGLHLSPDGCRILGEGLAGDVSKILR